MFGEQPRDRVSGERATAAGREQRILGLALAFVYPRLQRCDGLAVEWSTPLLASLAELCRAPDYAEDAPNRLQGKGSVSTHSA